MCSVLRVCGVMRFVVFKKEDLQVLDHDHLFTHTFPNIRKRRVSAASVQYEREEDGQATSASRTAKTEPPTFTLKGTNNKKSHKNKRCRFHVLKDL